MTRGLSRTGAGPGHHGGPGIVLIAGASGLVGAAAVESLSHLVFTALFEKPGLVRGWRDDDQMRTNSMMFRHLLDPLVRTLEHVTLLQGTKAYGAHLHPIPVPARERQPRDPHP
ncbi:MAG TPA: hypothetical protein VGO23_07825, partial [Pseudonocardia sp.]|nr:hypothetical protein [Pseudonocardia sp.]